MNNLSKPVSAQQIMTLFNQCFKQDEKTELIGNGKEPLYLPKEATRDYAQIIFTQDYVASALHEVAHWCIAGFARRQQLDYGYWYAPEGRNHKQQQAFYQVEIKPQALEWIFSDSCQYEFHISCDNFLSTKEALQDEQRFISAVKQQKQIYLNQQLPKRAKLFNQRLIDYYC